MRKKKVVIKIPNNKAQLCYYIAYRIRLKLFSRQLLGSYDRKTSTLVLFTKTDTFEK